MNQDAFVQNRMVCKILASRHPQAPVSQRMPLGKYDFRPLPTRTGLHLAVFESHVQPQETVVTEYHVAMGLVSWSMWETDEVKVRGSWEAMESNVMMAHAHLGHEERPVPERAMMTHPNSSGRAPP